MTIATLFPESPFPSSRPAEATAPPPTLARLQAAYARIRDYSRWPHPARSAAIDRVLRSLSDIRAKDLNDLERRAARRIVDAVNALG